MSILLDSLRKSEARRKIRETPSIHSAQDPFTGQPARQWVPLIMMGLAAIAIAWLGWRQYAAPPDPVAGPAPAAAQVQDRSAEDTNTLASSTSAQIDSSNARTPVERLSENRVSLEQSSAAAAGASPADRIAEYSGEDAAQVLAGDDLDAGDDTDESDVELLDDAVIDELAQRQAETRTALRREEPSSFEPRSYWQLPQSWRSEMPEFRITVLVYAEAPEERFLLMNGERLREGDEHEGVVLEEIRRDGAVFSYRRTRFLVKS